MSHDRNGALLEYPLPVPPRDALRKMALRLAEAGYAVIRWDKRGFGKSVPCPRAVSYADDVEDLRGFMGFARKRLAYSRIVVAGESAGAYVACLAAREGERADAYIFLGALYDGVEGLLWYNYGRFFEYAVRGAGKRRWAEKHAPLSLAIGEKCREIIEAVWRGEETFPLHVRGREWFLPLRKLREEIELPPSEALLSIEEPCLVLHGGADMNVRPIDAAMIEAALIGANNQEVKRVMIADADHSFQIAPRDEETRIRERHSFASFLRPYAEDLYVSMIDWLRKVAPCA